VRFTSSILLILLVAGLTIPAFGGDDGDSGVTIEWDFGYMPQKSEVSHTFYIHNERTEPSIVDKIKSGCSCTSISEIEEPIPPGDSVPITVSFKSGRYQGTIRKTTKVYCDGHDDPGHRLVITADIVKKGKIKDSPLIMAEKLEWRIEDGEWTAALDSVPLVNRTDDTLWLKMLEASREVIEVAYPSYMPPGDTAVVVLQPLPTVPPDPVETAAITMALVGRETTRVTIPIEIKR